MASMTYELRLILKTEEYHSCGTSRWLLYKPCKKKTLSMLSCALCVGDRMGINRLTESSALYLSVYTMDVMFNNQALKTLHRSCTNELPHACSVLGHRDDRVRRFQIPTATIRGIEWLGNHRSRRISRGSSWIFREC